MENAVAFGILALVILLLAQPWIFLAQIRLGSMSRGPKHWLTLMAQCHVRVLRLPTPG
jgi:hypothetical protein